MVLEIDLTKNEVDRDWIRARRLQQQFANGQTGKKARKAKRDFKRMEKKQLVEVPIT